MLLLAEVDLISKKRGYKRNLVWLGDFYNGKIVFTLLLKVITLYVGPTVVDIRNYSLKFVFRRSIL